MSNVLRGHHPILQVVHSATWENGALSLLGWGGCHVTNYLMIVFRNLIVFFNGGVNRLMSLCFLCDVWEKRRDSNNPTEGPIESEKSFFCTLEVR